METPKGAHDKLKEILRRPRELEGAPADQPAEAQHPAAPPASRADTHPADNPQHPKPLPA